METKITKSQLGYFIDHVSSILVKQLDQVLLEQLGIGYAQFKVLHVLAERGSLGQKHIADELNQTEASISRQIRLLKQSGFIGLEIDPDNRRQHIAYLTRKGFRFVNAADNMLAQYQYKLFAPLKHKEKSALQRTLESIYENASAI